MPAGQFLMGSPEDEPYRYDNEGPRHEVAIPRTFALGKYEVTREEFAAFVRSTGLDWPAPDYSQTDRDPAVNVSWNWAKQYVEWLSEQTGHAYRLPTEAEWEYALRAGTTSATPWGEGWDGSCDYANAWYREDKEECGDVYEDTSPAGTFRPNEFGLYDMSGNVWEWVEDCWHGGYSGAPSDGSAWTTDCDDSRVMRGGAAFLSPWDGRSAFRIGRTPGEDNRHLYRFGFRVVMTLE